MKTHTFLPLSVGADDAQLWACVVPGLGVLVMFDDNSSPAYVPDACIREEGYEEGGAYHLVSRTLSNGPSGTVKQVVLPKASFLEGDAPDTEEG